MKVYEGQGSIIRQAKTTSKNKIPEEANFQKIMDEMSSKSVNKGGLPGPEKMPPVDNGVQILYGIEKIDGSLGLYGKKQLVNDLQNTLDIIDFYSERLADSSIPASDLDSLVSHLEERLEGLKDLGASPNTPEKVRPIISDMVITIGAEISKYRRGDYL